MKIRNVCDQIKSLIEEPKEPDHESTEDVMRYEYKIGMRDGLSIALHIIKKEYGEVVEDAEKPMP